MNTMRHVASAAIAFFAATQVSEPRTEARALTVQRHYQFAMDAPVVALKSEVTDVADLVARPLRFSTPLGTVVTVNTTVHGDARNIAAIEIKFGSILAWGGTLTQVTPGPEILPALQIGRTKINAGSTLSLTIPTDLQMGMVFYSGTLSTSTVTEQEFGLAVSHWPLASTAGSAQSVGAASTEVPDPLLVPIANLRSLIAAPDDRVDTVFCYECLQDPRRDSNFITASGLK